MKSTRPRHHHTTSCCAEALDCVYIAEIAIEKPGTSRSCRERLEVLAKRRLIQGMTTDEFMEFSRGEAAEYRPETK